MTKLEKLIKEHCPNGVEYKTLGEITDFKNGTAHENDIVIDGHYTVVNSKFISTNGRVCKFAKSQICPVYKDDILMVMSDLPNGQALAKCFLVESDDKYTLNQRICSLTVKNKNEVNTKFLFYITNRNKQLLRYDNGVDQTNLKRDQILDIKIAVPPIKIQQEIVRILDTLTKYQEELNAELEARKKQYEYYRNTLLSFNKNNVRFLTLGEIAEYSQGRIEASKLNNENYIGVDNLLQDKKGKTLSSYVPNKGNFTRYDNGDILIGNIRPYLKKIWKANTFGGTNGDVLVIKIKDNQSITSDYLYYLLSSDEFFNYDMQHAKGAKMPRGNKQAVMSYPIPVPALEEQEKIVNILDRFETITTSLTNGLPAEIAARKKQYEYYRDKLLTF